MNTPATLLDSKFEIWEVADRILSWVQLSSCGIKYKYHTGTHYQSHSMPQILIVALMTRLDTRGEKEHNKTKP